MKNKNIIVIAFISLILFSTSCIAQQIVKLPTDAYKLKKVDTAFVGKPLGFLLQQIKPPILKVMAQSSNNIQSSVGYFSFEFVTDIQESAIKNKGKRPINIRVYVTEPFEWDRSKLGFDKRFDWSKADIEKYKNLPIAYIRVYGEE